MSVAGFPFLSCTLNLNSIATPAFSGPDGRCQVIFPPSEVDAMLEFAAADIGVSEVPNQPESSPSRRQSWQYKRESGIWTSPTNVHGNPRRSTISAKI